MRPILLDTGLEGARLACLRPMTGADELAAEAGALALLDRLLVLEGPATVPSGCAARLPVADRDRLLACVYEQHFGDSIEADATCPRCAAPFTLRLVLSAIVAEQRTHVREGVTGPDERSCYRHCGVRFRLPSTSDLDAAAKLAPEDRRPALFACCIVAGDPVSKEEAIEAAMEAVGPTLDVDLDTRCPHCGAAAVLNFEIGGYLLKSLTNGRGFLLREAHRIARAYRWSCGEIMSLSRGVRQDLVRLIDGELEPIRRPIAAFG